MNFLVRGFFGCLLKEVGPRSGRQRPGAQSLTGRFQTCTHVLIRVGFLRRGDRLGNRAGVFQLGLGQEGTQHATWGPTVRNRWACAGADAGPWGDDIVAQRSGLVKPSSSTSSRSQPMAMTYLHPREVVSVQTDLHRGCERAAVLSQRCCVTHLGARASPINRRRRQRRLPVGPFEWRFGERGRHILGKEWSATL